MNEKLAIHGGKPAVTEPLPVWPPNLPEIREALLQAFDNQTWGKYHAHPVEQFVESFRGLLNKLYVYPCCSGTIAVELALRGCGVTPGDEVILAAYDFPGNFRSIEAIGARPVLVDVVRDGWHIDFAKIDSAATHQTRALIASHLHGQLADVKQLRSICNEHEIKFVEDACQVPGATVAGDPIGTWSDVCVFSFGGSKLLSAGRGGALATDNEDILQRIKVFSERGNESFPMSQLQAAILVPQLEKLEHFHKLRLSSADYLRNQLANMSSFRVLVEEWSNFNSPAFYKFPLLLCEGVDRSEFVSALQAEGVAIDAGFRGFAKRSSRRCRQASDLVNSTIAAERTALLHHPTLVGSRQYLDQIISAIKKVAKTLSGVD